MSLQCDNLSGELQDQWSSSFNLKLFCYILNFQIIFVLLKTKAFSNRQHLIYTHGNKLGSTFSPWGKFEKNPFSVFLAILKFLSHICHILA